MYRIPPARRQRVIDRHDGRCALCGAKPPRLTMDHRVPLSLGGTSTEGNLQPACLSCNERKAAKLSQEIQGYAPAIYRTTGVDGEVLA